MLPRRFTTLLLLGALCTSGTVAASGAIYKWVDQNGVTQYSQTPPPKNAKNSQTVRVSTHVPVDVREGRAQGMVDAATLQAYTSPTPAQGTVPPATPEQVPPTVSDSADADDVSTSNPVSQPTPTPIVRPATSSPLIPLNTTGVDVAR